MTTHTGPVFGLVALVALAASPAPAIAQTQFWLETFENGCTTGCLADGFTGANGPWTVADVGFQGEYANAWFVSCAEKGRGLGQCGAGCSGTPDASLHVGNVLGSPGSLFCPLGDCGAAYDETDWTLGFGDTRTDSRIVSPLIDCTGRSTITVSFLWLGQGEPASADAAELEYSPDGGQSWSTMAIYAGGAMCGGGQPCGFFNTQGVWAQAIVSLPTSGAGNASNNPNVRIALRWHNNADGVGCDPSFAVDDISVRYQSLSCSPPGAIPMDLDDDLRITKSGVDVLLAWGPIPMVLPTTHYHVYRATNPSALFPTLWTRVAGDAPRLTAQGYPDPVLSSGATYYYDVRSASDCEGICPKPIFVQAQSNAPSCDSSGLVTFSPFISGGQPPFAYLWTFGNGPPNGTTGSAVRTYAYPPYQYSVNLQVTDSTPGGPQVRTSAIEVGVGPGNVSDTPTEDSPKPVGVPVAFASNPSGGAGPYTFQWSFGDGSPFSGVQNPTHAYAAAGTYTAVVTVVDASGCRVSTPLQVDVTP